MTTIELGGIVFEAWSESGWAFMDLTDWYSVPPSKAPRDSIPQGHGDFDPGIDWREGVVTSFRAVYQGSSEADALAAVEALTAIGTSSEQQTMTVVDALRPTSRRVSVEGVTVVDHRGWAEIEVAVDCFAADPIRYGVEVSAATGLPVSSGGLAFPFVFPANFGAAGDPGRVTLPNAGTQASWPRFTVRGGLSGGFSLVAVESGREIRFEFPLSDTDVVTVDARSGRAWINDESNSVTGYLTVADWWSVPAGESRTVQFNAIGSASGSPLLTGVVAPAFL